MSTTAKMYDDDPLALDSEALEAEQRRRQQDDADRLERFRRRQEVAFYRLLNRKK